MFVIGIPGLEPRMYLDGQGITIKDANRQLKTGEIVFTSDAHGGQGATINADGNGFDAHVITLAEAQSTAWKAAKAYRDTRLGGGCMTPLGRVQTDHASRTAISAAASTAATNLVSVPPWTISWTMKDNSHIAHSAAQMVALATAVTASTSSCQTASQTIRASIFSASTVAAVQAVDITAGYPAA